MNLDFIKTVKAEDYVSPSLELTTVGTEKGFCASPGGETSPYAEDDPFSISKNE